MKALLKYGPFTDMVDVDHPVPEITLIKPRGDTDLGSAMHPMSLEQAATEKNRLVFRYKEQIALYDNTPALLYVYTREE